MPPECPSLTVPSVQEDMITPGMAEKRSISADSFPRRGWPLEEFRYLAVDERPWYCFWNRTVGEFWIFLELEWDGSSASTTSAAALSIVTSTPTYPPHSGYGFPYTNGGSLAATTTTVGADSYAIPTSSPTWVGPKRRGYPEVSRGPEFPQFVKMVEKRKPKPNVQPYCQQMEVKPNWQIVPLPDVPTVCIEETEYSRAEPTGDSKRWVGRYDRRSTSMDELESMCICEWESG